MPLLKDKVASLEISDELKADIMELFGIEAGREVGIIKNQIREAILEGDIPNTREAALNFTIKKGEEIGLKVVANSKLN